MEQILIIEDERLIRNLLRERLNREGFRVLDAETGRGGLALLEQEDVDLLLLDHRLPDLSGLEVLDQVQARWSGTPVIMMTAYSTIENAVDAMKRGAYDYIGKPFNMDELLMHVRKALETRTLRTQVEHAVEVAREAFGFQQIIGDSAGMQQLIDLLRRIADSDASTVLIQGESGTGKDLIARAIHLESRRAAAPFMNITCSAVPATLLEPELFGHERGAFTDAKERKRGLFELADGGTVFLDEIGELPLSLQAKLLRVLEEKTFRRVGGIQDIHVDVRVIAATNVDLSEAAANKDFRLDLYYRLNVVPIHIPPLRERRSDIPKLAAHFLGRFNAEFKRQVHGFTPGALRMLERYSWPGNIRELRNLIERAMILGRGDTIDEADVRLEAGSQLQEVRGDGVIVLPPDGIELERVEAELVRQALERTNHNRTRAGELLGLTRDQIRYRIEKYKIEEGPGGDA